MDSKNESSSMDELTAEPVMVPLTAGERLRAAREEQGLDLAHIAAETRIPLRHLEAIEAGEFNRLPSRTYSIGFARTYARTLRIDDREIANAVRDELAEGYGRQSALGGGMEPGDPAKLPSAGLAWAGGIGALLLAIGVIAFYNTYFAAGTGPASLIIESEEPVSKAPAVASAAGDAIAAPSGAINPEGQVVFTALEDNIWVRFYEDDGDQLFEAQMSAGDTFEVPSDAVAPLINTGRPDALSITIDGREVPKLSNEPVTIGDAPISAKALLARAEPEAVAANAPEAATVQLN